MIFKPVCILAFLLIVQTSVAQKEEELKQSNVAIAVRAKVLGFVFIEDEWARSFSAGIEVTLFHHLGVVADIVHFRYKHEREVPINGSYNNGYDEYWQKDARNYCALEIRYYPFHTPKMIWNPYLNVYSKVGRRFLHTHELYPLESESEVYRLNSSFYDLGTSLGVKWNKNIFGWDLNIGAAYRDELKAEDIYHEDESWTYTNNVRDARWVPNIRFSFLWTLK